MKLETENISSRLNTWSHADLRAFRVKQMHIPITDYSHSADFAKKT